ncbi:MAG: TolC family outer membrane protein [Gammaproteobacteria bacterium]|nr:TolC family outer membrane protein [Gammaproteobacteria bacterium]
MKKTLVALALATLLQQAQAADLMAVYRLASENDPDLAAAQANRQAVLEETPLAKSNLLPSVTLSGDAGYNYDKITDPRVPRSSVDYTDASAAVQVVQPLYRKNLSIRVEQADDQVEQAEVDYAVAEQDLILRVANAYFGVLAAFDNVDFAVSERKAISRQLDQAQQRFDVGLIAITGVHEAQARFDQARADEIAANNTLDNAIEALLQITGERIESIAPLRRQIPLNNPEPVSLDAWADTALVNNPGVISAQYDAQIAKKQIDFQDAGDSPALDLVGSYGVYYDAARGTTDGRNGTIGLQLSIPLYTGGGVQAATRQARYQYTAAQELLERRRREVRTQVRNAYRGVLSSISRVGALEATNVSARSALEATEAGFDVGTRTLVDVLNSQRDLFAAKRDLAQSRYEYILNTLTLFQASGALDESDVELVNSWLDPSAEKTGRPE